MNANGKLLGALAGKAAYRLDWSGTWEPETGMPVSGGPGREDLAPFEVVITTPPPSRGAAADRRPTLRAGGDGSARAPAGRASLHAADGAGSLTAGYRGPRLLSGMAFRVNQRN